MPFDAAVALHQIGQFATALDVLAPFMECTDATGTEALWLASLCHVELGQHAEAVKCLELALVETWVYEPGRVALLYELGSVLEAMGDRTRARDCYLAVCRRAPWFRDAADRAGALAA
jgi:tetratricopeptide (TPR) repeat protein